MNEEEMQAHLRMIQAKNRVAITSQHLEELPNRFKGGQYVLDNSKSNEGHRVFSNNVSKSTGKRMVIDKTGDILL